MKSGGGENGRKAGSTRFVAALVRSLAAGCVWPNRIAENRTPVHTPLRTQVTPLHHVTCFCFLFLDVDQT